MQWFSQSWKMGFLAQRPKKGIKPPIEQLASDLGEIEFGLIH